jgi:Lrp/AsnC family leucine-responsive transcriptional regulator
MIDQTDIRILAILQQQARCHLADIAKEVDLSAPAVMERVKKLESRGLIKGYYALLDAKKVGKDITAFVGVSMSHPKYIDEFREHVGNHEDVLECHHVTGEESFLIKVKTRNTEALEKLLAEIHSLAGVTRTVTKVVLSTVKEGHQLALKQSEVPSQTAGREAANSGREKRIYS